ncbi:unnamed protein product [Cercospora beticola]|nr:unnamed protein product [Cercospora beticola]
MSGFSKQGNSLGVIRSNDSWDCYSWHEIRASRDATRAAWSHILPRRQTAVLSCMFLNHSTIVTSVGGSSPQDAYADERCLGNGSFHLAGMEEDRVVGTSLCDSFIGIGLIFGRAGHSCLVDWHPLSEVRVESTASMISSFVCEPAQLA